MWFLGKGCSGGRDVAPGCQDHSQVNCFTEKSHLTCTQHQHPLLPSCQFRSRLPAGRGRWPGRRVVASIASSNRKKVKTAPYPPFPPHPHPTHNPCSCLSAGRGRRPARCLRGQHRRQRSPGGSPPRLPVCTADCAGHCAGSPCQLPACLHPGCHSCTRSTPSLRPGAPRCWGTAQRMLRMLA